MSRKEEAIDRVERGASELWKKTALKAVKWRAKKGVPFTTDEVWADLEGAGVEPPIKLPVILITSPISNPLPPATGVTDTIFPRLLTTVNVAPIPSKPPEESTAVYVAVP